jgi:putative transposase
MLYLIKKQCIEKMLKTTRTYVAHITNHEQVCDELNKCGFSASKIWNVARYYTEQRWDNDGEIPDESELKSELKTHERFNDLHSQSSSFETAPPSRDANELRSVSTASS